MKLAHPALVASLKKAYSAEKAAALAYIGHAASLKNPEEQARVREIEKDEWDHRNSVRRIMDRYEIPVSKFDELKYALIGRAIGYSCFIIGRFMPYFFAGKLESGNVCEYIVMMRYFNEIGIHEHDTILYEMGLKEKEHEVYFIQTIKDARWLPLFERIFNWGENKSLNDVDFENAQPLENATHYCKSKGQRTSEP